jgi:cardiolipin synthase
VRVTILLQGLVEYRLLHYATQALYGNLLGCRDPDLRVSAQLPACQGGGDRPPLGDRRLVEHRSLQSAPGEGSERRRPRSAALPKNCEQSLAAAMRDGARELPADSWQRQPWYSRLLRRASYSLLRIFVGISGYGGKR